MAWTEDEVMMRAWMPDGLLESGGRAPTDPRPMRNARRRSLALLRSSLLVAIVGLAPAAVAPALAIHAGTCTAAEADDEFACAEILVALTPLTEMTIEQVVLRHGGMAADILEEHAYFGAFTIAVPAGREIDTARAYEADPDVEFARLVGANIISAPGALPDVAMPVQWREPLVWLGGLLLVVAFLVGRRRRIAP